MPHRHAPRRPAVGTLPGAAGPGHDEARWYRGDDRYHRAEARGGGPVPAARPEEVAGRQEVRQALALAFALGASAGASAVAALAAARRWALTSSRDVPS